jgi:flagellar biosynthesis chaperone FliJ
MNDIIDKVKMSDFKQRLQLEDEKNKCIKDIKDTCKQYKDQLASNMGISNEIDDILSGNVEKVTSSMDFNEVSKHIGNLEYSLIHGSRSSLEEYYRNRKDKDQTFAQYMNDNSPIDIDKVMSSKDVSEGIKGQLGLLESLKKQYENLFDIIDRIKKFKEESTEGLKKLQENMEKCLAETKNQGKIENKLEYDNGNIKKKK